VNDLFPPEEESVIDIDAALDTVVLRVSQDLINDIPAGDPRWMEMRFLGMLKSTVFCDIHCAKIATKIRIFSMFVMTFRMIQVSRTI
jgi:hypothetical protein